MLISFLNSHPEIKARGELLARLKGSSHAHILEAHLATSPSTKAVGFKLFYYHPMDHGHNEVWRALTDDRAIRIIHLKRKNILRTCLSRIIAETLDSWKDSGDQRSHTIPDKAVTVSHDELQAVFEQTEQWETATADIFSKHRYLETTYEALVESPTHSFREITDFLGVSVHAPTTNLVRQNPEPASQLIVNYDELKDSFRNTRWYGYFEE